MASVLTHAIIENAKGTVDSYVVSTNSLFQEIEGIISTLVASNFNGDAADGYKYFYTEKVIPALTQNLTDPNGSLTASIKGMLDSIEQQLLNTVDPQLGDVNRNPGAEN